MVKFLKSMFVRTFMVKRRWNSEKTYFQEEFLESDMLLLFLVCPLEMALHIHQAFCNTMFLSLYLLLLLLLLLPVVVKRMLYSITASRFEGDGQAQTLDCYKPNVCYWPLARYLVALLPHPNLSPRASCHRNNFRGKECCNPHCLPWRDPEGVGGTRKLLEICFCERWARRNTHLPPLREAILSERRQGVRIGASYALPWSWMNSLH